MIAAGGPEYAAARMHARLGQRPDAAVWRALCEARAIPPMLELLAGTTLAAVAQPLARSPDLHALDQAAWLAWNEVVREAAGWVAPELARAVAWCAPLPLLPALVHLARGYPALPWMSAYPELALASAVEVGALPAPRPGGELAALVAASDADGLAMAWLAAWRRRLPGAVRAGEPLGTLAAFVAAEVRCLGRAAPHEATLLRERLERGLLRHFRSHPQAPSAVFAWLGLAATDIRRLRGEFAWRIALPHARPGP